MNILYTSSPVKIGKHEWRVLVFTHQYLGNCTQYQWRKLPSDSWENDSEWPTYNHNDGVHSGLPKSIANKVYYPNADMINKYLKETPCGALHLTDKPIDLSASLN